MNTGIMNYCVKYLLAIKGVRLSALLTQCTQKRFYPALPKRFYKTTNVIEHSGKYEVILDHRKLKTPKGKVFAVKSEPLAIAVATEFDSQKQYVEYSKMHLSALCFTALDNPNNQTKTDLVDYLLNYLPTDTVLFQYDNEKDLLDLQKNEWDPIIEWFNKNYITNLHKTMDFIPPQISQNDRINVSKYLHSHDEDVLHGFVFAVDTLKSVLLAFAAIDQYILVDKAVGLARLEEEYQLKFWGRVEWSHDLSQQELQARLAAAVLFVHLNRSLYLRKSKICMP